VLVIPAVDIIGGKCVRLVQGDPKRSTVYFDNPVEAARQLEVQGAELIHLIDLDAALGSGQNLEAIKNILRELQVKVQIGGGIRTLEKTETLINLGAFRVIFGTMAVQNPALVQEAVHRFGSPRIAVAIDERYDKVTFHGWKEQSTIDYLDLASLFAEMRVGTIVFTSINADGTLRGPQLEKIGKLAGKVRVPIIASGGVASLNDLIKLAETGVEGVVVGTALYEGRFTLEQAIVAVKNVS
jgi:phosphoribosylformimino-5-aminoimidazole carboxamide ribotide isomerase